MKKNHAILLFLMIIGVSCLKDPDPDPPLTSPSGSFINLYNFLTESYDIAWEINDIMVLSEHTYGTALLEFIEMDEELQKPALGLVKLRFMHTTLGLDAVDLYIGGHTPEHKVVSEISFAQTTDYLEASQEDLWDSIIVTPMNVSPEDSSILSYTSNNVFLPNQIYLGVIGPTTNSSSSALQLQLYIQPVN